MEGKKHSRTLRIQRRRITAEFSWFPGGYSKRYFDRKLFFCLNRHITGGGDGVGRIDRRKYRSYRSTHLARRVSVTRYSLIVFQYNKKRMRLKRYSKDRRVRTRTIFIVVDRGLRLQLVIDIDLPRSDHPFMVTRGALMRARLFPRASGRQRPCLVRSTPVTRVFRVQPTFESMTPRACEIRAIIRVTRRVVSGRLS